MSRFIHCHPSEAEGLMWCQHQNGSWIAFPLPDRSGVGENENRPPEEDDFRTKE